MFNFFNSQVFIEIGEAIGNVAGSLVRRRRSSDAVEQSLHKWLAEVSCPSLSTIDSTLTRPDDDAIDATYRVLSSTEDES